MQAVHEEHDLHGTGQEPHEVYYLASLDDHDFWASVSSVPCPVGGCDQTVVWYEAGYVPGYRVCAQPGEQGAFLEGTVLHRFLASGDAAQPKLVRDHLGEAR